MILKNKLTSPIIQMQQRVRIVDSIRAFAVLLMIFTHVVAITADHEGLNKVIYYAGMVGGTASFTTFLFLFGASNFLAYVSIESAHVQKLKEKRLKLLARSFQILGIYYLLAFSSVFVYGWGFRSDSNVDLVKDFFAVIFFIKVPPFTEFLIAFILFNITSILFKQVYALILKHISLVVLFSVLTYTVGHLLYQVDFGITELNLAKAVVAGHENLHLFPLLQYYPVFFIGLYLGKIIHKHRNERSFKLTGVLWVFLAIFGVGTLLSYNLEQETGNYLFRWSVYDGRFPPAIGFLFLSLFITVLTTQFFNLTEKFTHRYLDSIFAFISKHTLSYFVFHTVILFGFQYILETQTQLQSWKVSYPGYIFGLFGLVILITTLLIFVKQFLIKKLHSRLRYNDLINLVLILLGLLFIILTFAYAIHQNFIKNEFDDLPQASKLQRKLEITNNPEFWYDHSYKYYQQIKLGDIDTVEIPLLGEWRMVEFNHRQILNEEKINDSSGNDIQVVRFENNGFNVVPAYVKSPGSENTQIYFKVSNIDNTPYYLYYGGFANDKVERLGDTNGHEQATKINLDSQHAHLIDIKTNKKWFLKDYPDASKLNFTITIPDSISKDLKKLSGEYQIIKTDKKGNLEFDQKSKSIDVDLNDLEVGSYLLQASIYHVENGIKIYKTYEIPFQISYPVYVSWSIDWEGWGVANSDLNDIVDISNKFGMPITHFFNPRIYIKKQYSIHSVGEGEANYYTAWVLDRKAKGDEIGLHLHFYPDLLEEIGVKVNKDATLVGIGRDETYIHGYTETELDKIFKWSLNKFAEKGLGFPVSFRSGAWMSSPTVLRVLEMNGILIDSSGRSGGILNPAIPSSTPIPWVLPENVRPFKPNTFNINSWEQTQMGIWEFPNNGADSYWFSSDDLKRRFDITFKDSSKIMTYPQAVVYLSHPHGFTIYDSKKIRELFEHTNRFKFSDDNGPVIYSTIENIYNSWNQSFDKGQ